MEKKKIGIIGYWFATNYGGVASYYSLYSVLKKMEYTPFLVETPYLRTDKEGEDVFSRNFFRQINAEVTECFEIQNLSKLNELADIFLLGSDQVMTTNSIKHFGKLFLMDFLNNSKKRIAVSVSCGGDNLDSSREIIDYAGQLLEKFQAISVREESARKIFKNKFGLDADCIIDPIFLTSAQEYKNLDSVTDKFENGEKYLASYILDPTEDKKLGIKYISEQLQLSNKIILDGRKFTHEKNNEILGMQEVTLPELDFIQWIHYMSEASFIFTDSFHGAAMAIILNKPFIMYANHKRGYPRFLNLAETFQLHHRLVLESKNITSTMLQTNIDYEIINQRLEMEKEKALKWIQNALSEKEFIPNLKQNPVYAIESYKNKSKEKYDICRKDKCTGCFSCMNVCPKNCITMLKDKEGFFYPFIDKDECVKCGACSKVCPGLHWKKDETKRVIKVFAGYSLDENVRYMSSSGGAFSEFAKFILKMSGVCYGAAYDSHHSVFHTRITSENQLSMIRQSKYVQSNIGQTYTNVKKDLQRGLYVLFCGTPCQCAALKLFLGKEYAKLLLVDFICSAICSPKAYQYYLKDIEELNHAEVLKVWFRNKETTWKAFSVKLDFKEKKDFYREISKNDMYFKAFIKFRISNRPSCYNCQFKGTDRASDITLADYWGLKWNNPNYGEEEMKKGVSLILFNSKKGLQIFEDYTKYQMYTEEHTLEDAVKGNGGYYYSQKPGLYRDYFFENLGKIPFHTIIENMEKNEEYLRKEREQGS